MRIAFFALLFANLAYFAWAKWIDTPPPSPVNTAIDRLPHLRLAQEVPLADRTNANPQLQIACLSVGPFADLDNSAHAVAILKGKGFDPKQRAEEGPLQEGFWVYVGGFPTQQDTDRALVALERGGIRDAVVMPEAPDVGRRLSLGLYSDRARAERRAEAVRGTGLKADVVERKLPETQYWVDLAPLPGTNTVPIDGLFAEGVGSRIAVQPCPSAAASKPPSAPNAPAAGTGTATSPAPPTRAPATAGNSPMPTAANAPPGQAPAATKPP